MLRRSPRSTRTDTLFPYTTLFRSAEACALLGTVLVAGEGINLFLAGSDNAIEDFLQQLRADPRLAGLQVKYSRSAAQPFARLKVKVKPGIISFRRDDASPLGGRAPAVAPADLDGKTTRLNSSTKC